MMIGFTTVESTNPQQNLPYLLTAESTPRLKYIYRPQRSCGQGNIFTPVCHSVQRGGGGLPQCMLGYHPPGADTPPGPDPPGKQTPAYGLRAAGTHPTGMHSCLCINQKIYSSKNCHQVVAVPDSQNFNLLDSGIVLTFHA